LHDLDLLFPLYILINIYIVMKEQLLKGGGRHVRL
jgi:hypothetical protein